MKPLIVLLAVFAGALLATKLLRGSIDYALSGRIALAATLLFTAMGHFAFTKGMTMMLPEAIPFRYALVYLTGVAEILFAIALFIPSVRVTVGWVLIAFFICMLPANIYAAMKNVDYQHATYDGPGLGYLWFRIPLQLLFIVWTYLAVLEAGEL